MRDTGLSSTKTCRNNFDFHSGIRNPVIDDDETSTSATSLDDHLIDELKVPPRPPRPPDPDSSDFSASSIDDDLVDGLKGPAVPTHDHGDDVWMDDIDSDDNDVGEDLVDFIDDGADGDDGDRTQYRVRGVEDDTPYDQHQHIEMSQEHDSDTEIDSDAELYDQPIEAGLTNGFESLADAPPIVLPDTATVRRMCPICGATSFKGNRLCPCPKNVRKRDRPSKREEFQRTLTASIDSLPASVQDQLFVLSHVQFRLVNHSLALATVMTHVSERYAYLVTFKGMITAFGKTLKSSGKLRGDPIPTVPNELTSALRDIFSSDANYASMRALLDECEKREADPGATQVVFSFNRSRMTVADVTVAFIPNPTLAGLTPGQFGLPSADDNSRPFVNFDSPKAAFYMFPLLFPDTIGFTSDYRAFMGSRSSLKR
ncbi:hypothetical protein J8273_3904 [Carpediemonas membranifera]|uniref:Uncharacterized protein n=1 Tax=Carpediemonas membranifera TaxID=201153 RepID=A0A8J6AYM9_9EUKA|nr:hypothetical protein J8273_3904 [Carpediemonas membranifera]|eukprot:KAG9394650.1 hypothetical protein J8273_3904 [Carpediemonas membranifera]